MDCRLITAVLVLGVAAHAQDRLTAGDLARADAAVRSAFRFLYAFPPDTAGARMNSWVLDTSATTPAGERTGTWRILVNRLTDTGRDLPLADVLRETGTSPAQLAESIAAVQRLESRVSKAEAEAAFEVLIAINEPARPTADGAADETRQTRAPIPGARLATRMRGDWIRYDDREGQSERWSPGGLIVEFAGRGAIQTINLTASGAEDMIERLLRETNWKALAELVED